MASRNFDASRTPRSIAAERSLTNETEYVGQNVDPKATLYVRESATQPAVTERAHRHEAGGFFYFTPGGGSSLWAWTDDTDGCRVIVTEA